MPAQDFLFALQLSDETRVDQMLVELASAIASHSGLGADACAATMGDVRQALTQGTAAGHHRCDVKFRVTGGELAIEVSYANGPAWRKSVRLA